MTPHSILSDARESLALIGEGDWTPQDSHLVAVLTYAERLEEQLDTCRKLLAESYGWMHGVDPKPAQPFLDAIRDAIDSNPAGEPK